MEYKMSKESCKIMVDMNPTLQSMLSKIKVTSVTQYVDAIYELIRESFQSKGDKNLDSFAYFLAEVVVLSYFQSFDNDKRISEQDISVESVGSEMVEEDNTYDDEHEQEDEYDSYDSYDEDEDYDSYEDV